MPIKLEDIPGLSDDALSEALKETTERGKKLAADPESAIEDLQACLELNSALRANKTARADAKTAADAARTELAAAVAAPDESESVTPAQDPDPETAPADTTAEPVAVVASRHVTRSTIDPPPAAAERRTVVMTTASDVPGFASGTELASFADAGKALENRMATYALGGAAARQGGKEVTPEIIRVGPNAFISNGRSMTRHSGVIFRRDFPDELRIRSASDAFATLTHATDERRLPGGSLIESARRIVESGKSLTAAIGWCSPSLPVFELCDMAVVDGILGLPETQSTRGGFLIPDGGGPNFASIWNGIGDGGDVILTEYDVENGAEKICFEIPCPEFVDIRMDVIYFCLTGSLLQSRGYPEVVQKFSREGVVALAHKMNQSVIARIEAASTGPTVIPTITGSDDAASQLLSAVELAIIDINYANRRGVGATAEVVLPVWAIAPIRAALARRTGVAALDVTDAQIMNWFAIRKAVVNFVYDWQDAFSGQADGPGGATPLTEFPDTVRFIVYPAGTWAKMVRDVINLDTIYDNANLTLNQYTAIFTEDGFNVMQMCPDSRVYEVGFDPAGIVGCCESS